ncbi:gliding motility-associated-like protein [Lutibacter oceani]|uniref:Gliding motility-associated-like protein n=1 Tax=Lutibacter oceani TaxID=1853311 RepID=A0A3D9RIX9_9FLAO|nr:T9SS type B sorting domain-containing protein [Lutibacter oceani]REE79809.1 gliding motility-associated-like protein [Lutibacter oceani]
MKKLIGFIFFCSFSLLYAQGEANTWYFGEKAGLDFNTGDPVAISDGKLNTREGCSSFSDAQGNLLFYSDGSTVWNKNHNPMPNGTFLKGDASSSQSAMIIPKPNSTTEYYLFTVGARVSGGEYGFYYYTIDMNANGGLGDVTIGPVDLNEGRAGEWSEKVAAINGEECETFWVISYVSNQFKAYKVTENGVAVTPVTSTVNYFAEDRRGYLKISPDGKKIAIAHMSDRRFILYDFNNATGVVSNQQILDLIAPGNAPYGAEFSGNGEKLYVTASNDFYSEDPAEFNNPNNQFSTLYQFDITKQSTTAINNSRVVLDSQNLYRGALQLGPDQKIYRAMSSSYSTGLPFLSVIENPENDGLNCNYKNNVINLGSNKSTQGLPPFIASIFYLIEITNEVSDEVITNQTIKLCTGNNYTFKSEILPGSPVYNWKFKDSIISNSTTITLTNIEKQNAGLYQLEVDLVDECGKSILYQGKFEVEVYDPPVAPENIIYDQCDIDANSLDGITLFNLETKIPEITNNNSNLEVTFYDSEISFNNNNPILSASEYISATNPNLIFKITDKRTDCFNIGTMELNAYPTSLDTYNTLYICENDLGIGTESSIGSGEGTFDFEAKRDEINTLFSNYNIVVEFYENSQDAQLQVNKITGTNNYSNTEIYVRISNKDNNNCISAGKFNLVVNQIPEPNSVDEIVILCIGNIEDTPRPYSVALDGNTYVQGDKYQWYLNKQPLTVDATNPIYFAKEAGFYEVEVLRDFENDSNNMEDNSTCIGFSNFVVITSNIPVIYPENIIITDDSNNNTITINNNELGIGDYEYTLNDFYGEYQDEPYFENVPAGIHTIYVRDKNGCGFSQLEVSVLGFPKFFTPNNDGINDTWRIPGANSNFYPSSNIYIFDRFGKFITSLNPNNIGWDGTLNGKYLPSTDYWYSVELKDQQGNTRIKKGHFSLIRR